MKGCRLDRVQSQRSARGPRTLGRFPFELLNESGVAAKSSTYLDVGGSSSLDQLGPSTERAGVCTQSIPQRVAQRGI